MSWKRGFSNEKKGIEISGEKSNKTKNQFNRKKIDGPEAANLASTHTYTRTPTPTPTHAHSHTHTPNHAHTHARTHSLPPHTHRPTQSCFTSGSMESAATGAGPSDERRMTSKLGWLPGGLK